MGFVVYETIITDEFDVDSSHGSCLSTERYPDLMTFIWIFAGLTYVTGLLVGSLERHLGKTTYFGLKITYYLFTKTPPNSILKQQLKSVFSSLSGYTAKTSS